MRLDPSRSGMDARNPPPETCAGRPFTETVACASKTVPVTIVGLMLRYALWLGDVMLMADPTPVTLIRIGADKARVRLPWKAARDAKRHLPGRLLKDWKLQAVNPVVCGRISVCAVVVHGAYRGRLTEAVHLKQIHRGSDDRGRRNGRAKGDGGRDLRPRESKVSRSTYRSFPHAPSPRAKGTAMSER